MGSGWIVRWRGLEEPWPSAQEAMDRLDQLEARGIEAEVLQVADEAASGPAEPTPGLPAEPVAAEGANVGRPRSRPS